MSSRRNLRGRDGAPGLPGPIPKHEWKGSLIRFQKNDHEWSEWTDIAGPKGDKGDDGLDVYALAVKAGFNGSLEDWLASINVIKGDDGKSAYEIAKINGFKGTPTEWLLSLRGKRGLDGKKGEKGDKGDKGDPGEEGLSAYEVWLRDGHKGTEDDFFEWLAEKVREKIKSITQSGAGPLRIKLNMLDDVNTQGAVNGNALVYLDGKWVPGEGGGGSNPARVAEICVTNPNGDSLTTGDGKMYFMVPPLLNGYNLTEAVGYLSAASTSGTPTIQIRNVTQAADMLSTKLTIDEGDYSSLDALVPPVIDTGNDDVASGDRIAIDIDVAGSGAKGLFISLKFELP